MYTFKINSNNNRLLKKAAVVFFLIIGALGLFSNKIMRYTTLTVPVVYMPSQRHHLSCPPDESGRSISSQITCNQCPLSLLESDGWFCEFDKEWHRRKSLHLIQDRKNHISNERTYFFLHNWHPTIHCQFERRIGDGDGGKWVCDIHKLKLINSPPPLVYSFGSNGDFAFERALKEELPESDIHTFDQNSFICPVNICTFHQIFVGNGKKNQSKTLQMVLDDLDHRGRDVDILKVDIEGTEFELFHELFREISLRENALQTVTSKTIPYIRQILVEIHLGLNAEKDEPRQAHALFENFRRNNYAIFHKEANLADCRNIVEYGFIRLNPSFFVT